MFEDGTAVAMMESELMTLKDIAQLLGLPESTLRKYRDAYPQFIPYVGSGRERRYREDAMAVFRAIRDCRVERHLSWEDTERDLLDRFPVNADALGKKAVVGEDEANLFLEKLDRAVRQLTSQGERQEFVASTLANELLQMKKMVEKLEPIMEDVQIVRRTVYSYNEVVQRQYKEGQKNLTTLMELLANLQGALHYMPGEITKAVEMIPKPVMEPVHAAPAPAREPESQVVARLREDLKHKEAEAEKFRDLYVRAKREIDRLREELKKKTLDELYGPKKPGAPEVSPAQPGEQAPARGGKFFFRGKKK